MGFPLGGGCCRWTWWRVVGTAELPHIDQSARQQFQANMSLLPVFKRSRRRLHVSFDAKVRSTCVLRRNGSVTSLTVQQFPLLA